MAASGKLKYNADWYNPKALRDLMKAGGASEVRKEYTRLRDISQKRLKRMGKTQFARTQTYKRNVNHYPLLKNIQSESELAARLSDLSRFIETKTSTVSGMKSQMKKALETLHKPDHGYFFVTEENFLDFGEFMEEYRFQKLDEEYDSGEAADTFNALEKHRVDPTKVQEDFEFWLQNRKLLETMGTGKGKEIQESTLRSRLIKFAAEVDKEVFGMNEREKARYNKLHK